MRIMNATALRKNLFDTLNQTVEFKEVVNVPMKSGNIVIMSEEEYNGMKETLYLLSQPEIRERLLKTKDAPEEDFIEFDWRKELNV